MSHGADYSSWRPRRISNDYFGVDIGLRGPWLLGVITACASTAFSLVGYDNGVLGGVINTPAFQRTFDNPDANQLGNIVSLYEIGCFFGAMATFVVGEPLGRRRTILLGSLFMIAGAIVQAASSSYGVMILGRIVSGLGMGAINSTVPMLQAECSPAVSRGRLVCFNLTILNVGIVLSYWIGYAFSYSGGGSAASRDVAWRFPVGLQLVFVGVLIATTLVIPDTPRWLASRGRESESLAVLERLHNAPATSDEVQQAFAGIRQAIEHEKRAASNVGWLHLVKPQQSSWRDDAIRSRRRLGLACFIQAAQQLGGINALIYYSATLFSQSIGLGDKDSALMAGGLNMSLVLGSVISILLIDRVGRRWLLLPCIAGMAAVMAAQSGLVYKTQQPGSPAVFGRAASAMLFLFQLFFSVGFQGTVWLIPSEVLPLTLRTKGSALSTAANWICNFLVRITPNAIQNLRWRTYLIFMCTNAAWLPVIAIFLPETKGKTLEEVDELFAKDGWHIDHAKAAQQTQRATARGAAAYDDEEAGSVEKHGQRDDDLIDGGAADEEDKKASTAAGRTGATGASLAANVHVHTRDATPSP